MCITESLCAAGICTSYWVLSHSVVSDSLPPHGLEPARLLCPWDSPGKGTGVGFHALLQGIFPTQVSCIAGGFFKRFRQKEHREHGGSAVFWSEGTTGGSASLV